MTVRVGHIGFLNCYPLYYGLEHCGVLAADRRLDLPGRPGIEMHPGVPTELNRWLVDGEIDLGLISSIAYARNHRQLLLSRNVSISSLGAVDSIQLVSRRPLDEIRTIALTRQSATSVAMLKTLFKLRFRQEVTYGEIEGSVTDALKGVRRGASHRRPGPGGPLLPGDGRDLPRSGGAVAGMDRSPYGLRRVGGAGGIRPHQRGRTRRRGTRTGGLCRLWASPPG